jgi:hypothetical protein
VTVDVGGVVVAFAGVFGLLPVMANQDATSVQVRHLVEVLAIGSRAHGCGSFNISCGAFARWYLRFAIGAQHHALRQLFGRDLLLFCLLSRLYLCRCHNIVLDVRSGGCVMVCDA